MNVFGRNGSACLGSNQSESSPTTTPEATPHEKRRGMLKNGNPSGDFSKASRCGAKNRCGVPCQCPGMANGRCRLHGGSSTGAKTAEGIERIRTAVTRHGRYSGDAGASEPVPETAEDMPQDTRGACRRS